MVQLIGRPTCPAGVTVAVIVNAELPAMNVVGLKSVTATAVAGSIVIVDNVGPT